jgi:hypothetical protein
MTLNVRTFVSSRAIGQGDRFRTTDAPRRLGTPRERALAMRGVVLIGSQLRDTEKRGCDT